MGELRAVFKCAVLNLNPAMGKIDCVEGAAIIEGMPSNTFRAFRYMEFRDLPIPGIGVIPYLIIHAVPPDRIPAGAHYYQRIALYRQFYKKMIYLILVLFMQEQKPWLKKKEGEGICFVRIVEKKWEREIVFVRTAAC
jgi:hypothetical protein